MDRKSVRHNGTGSRKSQEPDAAEETSANRGTTRTVTSSQRVVTRRSVAGVNSFNYEVDPWEISPKTDYTYSRTRSYLKQPVVETYISPNMSRQSLHGSARDDMHEYASAGTEKNSSVVRNLILDGSYEEEASGSVGGRGVSMASATAQASRHSGSGDTYMTLRSRTLMTQHDSGSWQTDNTYTLRNMHGTDLEEEVSDTESIRDHRPIMIKSHSLADRFMSFIVTVVQTCWTVVTYLPRTAISKASTLVVGMSKSKMYDGTHRTTKRTRLTNSTTTTTAVLVSDSRWRNLQNAVLWVVNFLLVTLPVGLVSWAVFGIISSAKLIGSSAVSVGQWCEKILQSTVTKTSRITDAAILSWTSLPRRRYGCLCLLPFLFLVPLLVFGLLYSGSCRSDDVAVVGSTVYDRFSMFFFPLFATRQLEEQKVSNRAESTVVVDTGGAGRVDTDSGNVVKNDVSLAAFVEMEKRMHELFLALAADHKATAQAEQDRALSSFRSHLVRLVKMIVQRELQVQRISIKTAEEGGRAILMAEHQKQMAALQHSLDALAAKANTMSAELNGLKGSLSTRSEPLPPSNNEAELLELRGQIKTLDDELTHLKETYDDLTATLIRTRIREYFFEVMGTDASGSGSIPGQDGEAAKEDGDSRSILPFGIWLNQRFTNREDMNQALELLAANITKDINEKTAANEGLMARIAEAAVVAKWASEEEKHQQDASAGIGIAGTTGGATEGSAPCTLCEGQLTVADVLKMIRSELGIYDADKTGKVDFALESAGGSIISVRCSETYQLQTAQTSIFGIPLWYTYNSPRVIIQPGVHPGECWAFTGSQGYVVVQLSRQIYITEVSIEHIPRTLAPSGRLDSAPKDFEIWGLESETDLVGVPLGNFTYNDFGTPLQSFSVESTNAASFRFVELKIKSNYGQESYTCLYRFRVHGYLDPSLA